MNEDIVSSDMGQRDVWACGHTGFPSIHPDKNGSIQCTDCANRQRDFMGFLPMRREPGMGHLRPILNTPCLPPNNP